MNYPSLVENLEFITLYVYEDKFLLEPNVKATGINTNLTIDRRKQDMEEISTRSITQTSPLPFPATTSRPPISAVSWGSSASSRKHSSSSSKPAPRHAPSRSKTSSKSGKLSSCPSTLTSPSPRRSRQCPAT